MRFSINGIDCLIENLCSCTLFVFYSHEGCDTVKKRKSIVYTFIKLSRPRAGEGGQY